MNAPQQSTSPLLGGGILAVGLAIAAYSRITLDLGSFIQPGPGGFPFVLGVLLMLNGAISLFLSLKGRRNNAPADISPSLVLNYRVLVIVILAIAAFALLLETFGLAPACFALILLSSGVIRDMSLLQKLIASVLGSALAVLIFAILLAIPVHIFTWPFGGLK